MAAIQSSDDHNIDVFRSVNRARILPIGDDPVLLAQIEEVAKLTRGDAGSRLIRWWTETPRIGFLEYGFSKLKELKQRHGFAVVVVAIPSLDQRRKAQWRIVNEIIGHESRKFGFHFVDVFDEFEEAGLRALRNEPDDDIHPNIKGHAILAKEIERYLVDSGLVE
jgi:hypothetical protein